MGAESWISQPPGDCGDTRDLASGLDVPICDVSRERKLVTIHPRDVREEIARH